MRRQTRLGGLFVLMLVALFTPMLVAAPAQATNANVSFIEAAGGTPFGISKGAPFAVNREAEKALGSRLHRGSSYTTNVRCAEPGYVQAFDATGNGGHIHSSFPGLTMSPQNFAIILQRGVVYPGSNYVWLYRWNNDSEGFNYYTTPANENCLVWDQDNPLSAQAFPVGTTVNAYACFFSWELQGQLICGFVGYVNRIS